MSESESESEIEEFVETNWKKTGLFDFFYTGLGCLGGDAVASIDGGLTGVEFETYPSRYFDHNHHLNPNHETVSIILANRSDGVPRGQYPERIKMILTKPQLEELIKKRGGKEVDSNPEAKRKIEKMVEAHLKDMYKLMDVKVEIRC